MMRALIGILLLLLAVIAIAPASFDWAEANPWAAAWLQALGAIVALILAFALPTLDRRRVQHDAERQEKGLLAHMLDACAHGEREIGAAAHVASDPNGDADIAIVSLELTEAGLASLEVIAYGSGRTREAVVRMRTVLRYSRVILETLKAGEEVPSYQARLGWCRVVYRLELLNLQGELCGLDVSRELATLERDRDWYGAQVAQLPKPWLDG